MARPVPLLRPQIILLSWLVAAAALPAAVVLVAAGQGLGALAGGASWIGVCTPIHRQPWAIVNEPALTFAASSHAAGYWLGSVVLPALIAAAAIGFLPRRRTLASELAAVQLAWACAAAALGIVPPLDGAEGHVARWLQLHRLPGAAVWAVPLAGTVLALPAALHLLALDREAVRAPSRLRRIAVVTVHLLVPAAAWLLVIGRLRGAVPRGSAAGFAAVALGTLLAAAAAVPRRLPFHPEPPGAGTFLRVLAAAALLWAAVLAAGRPLPGNRAAALLWGRPSATNTLRSWMEPVRPDRLRVP